MNPENYDLTIDYLDIVCCSRLQIPNEEAIFNDDDYYVKNYKFNYMIQMEVSCINGLTVVTPRGLTADKTGWDENDVGSEIEKDTKAIISRSNISLANIFFKVRLAYTPLTALLDAPPRPFTSTQLPGEQRRRSSC